jgi:hypothetical protein
MAITLRITRDDIAKYLDKPLGLGKPCKAIHPALAAFDLAYPDGIWFDEDWTAEKEKAYAEKRRFWYAWLLQKGLMPGLAGLTAEDLLPISNKKVTK